MLIVVQHVFLRLLGQAAMWHAHVEPASTVTGGKPQTLKRVLSNGEISGAFACVTTHPSNVKRAHAQSRFALNQAGDESSPLYGFAKQDVKAMTRNQITGRSKWKCRTFCPLTLLDLHPTLFGELKEKVIPMTLEKSVILLGRPGKRKSQASFNLGIVL